MNSESPQRESLLTIAPPITTSAGWFTTGADHHDLCRMVYHRG